MRILPLVLLAFVASTSSQAAFDFKGDPLGMPLSEYVLKYDRLTMDAGRRAPNIIIESLDRKPTSFRKYVMVRVEKFFGFEDRGGPKETVAGVPARVAYSFFASSQEDWDMATAPRREQRVALDKIGNGAKAREARLKFVNPRPWTEEEKAAADRVVLGSISIRFPKSSFLQVLGALTEKYGPPASTTTNAMQNAMGATYTSRVVKWVSDGDEIEMSELSHDIEATSLEFRRIAVINQASEASKSERQKDAKDL